MKAPVCLGELRHYIDIQSDVRSDVAGRGGEVTVTTHTLTMAWAKIEPLTGGEQLKYRALEAKVSHRVTMRYFPGVTAQHRIVFNGRTFNVRFVRNLEERNEWLEILADEGVAP